jgi:dTDP-4-dehydrorhamnose reductase
LSVYSRAKFAAEQAVVEENPQAIIARVNIYGWGITGKRSLAEFFYNNLSVGKPSPGFTDVFFCPLLVNDLSQILLKMMEKNLEGLYHVVGGEGISKYSFGMALAERFGFDASLVRPASVNSAGLQAARSQHLVLRTDKIAHALGEAPPGLAAGMERFYQLYQQGYPQLLRSLAQDQRSD